MRLLNSRELQRVDIEVVRQIANQRPFRAIRFHLLEVRHFDATHPEVLIVDDVCVSLAAITSPDDYQAIDPHCISRIQYIPPSYPHEDAEIPI